MIVLYSPHCHIPSIPTLVYKHSEYDHQENYMEFGL